MIVARVRGGRARLRCVSPAEALRAWAPATAPHLPFDHGSVVATLAHVVRRVPCFGLDVGDDAAELAGAVGDALERVRKMSEPLVSVVMPAFEEQDFIAEALDQPARPDLPRGRGDRRR